MATFLLTTNGTHGDVLPFVRLAAGLAARGHEAILYTHAYYAETARSAGIGFVATDTEDAYAQQLADARRLLVNVLADPNNVLDFHHRNGLFDQIRFEFEAMAEIVRARGPRNVVVVSRHTSGLSVLMLQEAYGVPAAWVAMSPTQLMATPLTERLYARQLAGPVDELRASVGLGPVVDWPVWLASPQLMLGLWPAWFDAAGEPAPTATALTGFLPHDDAERGPLPPEVAALLGSGTAARDRPVLVTGGSGQSLHADWYAVAIDAATRTGRPVIVACRHPELLPDVTLPRLQVHPSLPFGTLMPQVSAVLHHGGILTSARAVASGVPQLVLAHGTDRPDNAARLRRMGLGEWLPPARWDPRQAARLLHQVTDADGPRQRAEELAGSIDAGAAVQTACARLEALLDYSARTPSRPAVPRQRVGSNPRDRLDGLSPERRALLGKWLARQTEPAADSYTDAPPQPTLTAREPRSSGHEDAPCSFPQRRVWLGMQLDPDSVGFHVCTALRLRGALDIGALQHAVDGVVSRHDALRTVPVAGDGEPRQRVVGVLTVPLRVHDLTINVGTDHVHAARQVVESIRGEPFNLEGGPLVRFAVLRLGAGDHVLVLVAHHFIVDGASVGIVIRELAARYAAWVRRTQVPVAPTAVQYPDVARWQRDRFTGSARERTLAYWRSTLSGAGEPLLLPLAPAARETVHGLREAPVELAPEVVRRLLAASGTVRGSLAPVLLTAFKVLLARYTDQWDLTVGLFVAGRAAPELADVVGNFTELAAVRSDLRDGPAFPEAVRRVRAAIAGALAASAPFEDVVAEVASPRVPGRPPLVQVGFNLHNFAFEHAVWPDLTAEVWPVDSGHTDLDLTLVAIPTHDGGVRAVVEYPAERFAPEDVAGLVGHFRALVEGLAADPDGPVWRAGMIPAAERFALAAWSDG